MSLKNELGDTGSSMTADTEDTTWRNLKGVELENLFNAELADCNELMSLLETRVEVETDEWKRWWSDVLRRSALLVQRNFRGKAARRYVEKMRARRAAIYIQTRYRAHMTRRRYYLHLGALKIQTNWRTKVARREFLRIMSRRTAAAVMIQSIARGVKVRESYRAMLARRDEMMRQIFREHTVRKSCILIQRVWRSHRDVQIGYRFRCVAQAVRAEIIQRASHRVAFNGSSSISEALTQSLESWRGTVWGQMAVERMTMTGSRGKQNARRSSFVKRASAKHKQSKPLSINTSSMENRKSQASPAEGSKLTKFEDKIAQYGFAEPTVTAILEKRTSETLSAGENVEYLVVWNRREESQMWISRSLLLNVEATNEETTQLVRAYEREQAELARAEIESMQKSSATLLQSHFRRVIAMRQWFATRDAVKLIQCAFRGKRGRLEGKRQRLLLQRRQRREEQAELQLRMSLEARAKGDSRASGDVSELLSDLCANIRHGVGISEDAGESMWKCKWCKFENEIDERKCLLCHKAREFTGVLQFIQK